MNWYCGRGLCLPRASETDIRAESPEYPSAFRGIERAGLVLLLLLVFATRLPWQSEEQMLDYQKLGHEVYFLEGLDYHYLQTHGVNIVKLGAKPLFAENSTLEAGRGQ